MIHLDFETRSKIDIWEVGAWAYSAHPSTEILCMAYAIDEEPVKTVTREDFLTHQHLGWPCEDLLEAIMTGVPIAAYNAFFEQCIWQNIMVPYFGQPRVPIKQWRCIMAKARARSLPRSLANCCKALHTDHQKDEAGKRIMMKLAKPNSKGDWNEDPEDFEKLYQYCIDDVAAERSVDKVLPDLIPSEQTIWFLDQIINSRGISLDTSAISAALSKIDLHTKTLNQTVLDVSEGALDGVTRRMAVLTWCQEQGVNIKGYTKEDVKNALEQPNLPENVRIVLEAKSQLGKTSTAKYQAMYNAVTEDGRIRDTLLYHGANTGRWAGKLIQIHNLPKGNVEDTDQAVQILKHGDFELMYPDVMGTLSSCIRGMIIASPGHDLIVADYGAIEARVVMWLAGEERGLKQFRAGEDMYVEMARIIYGGSGITKAQRQLGKAAILGCIAEGSMIYSDTGFIPIETINQGQKVWDGDKWVNFQEKVYVGKKNVIEINSVKLTKDHLILTTYGWQTAAEIAISGDMKRLKLGPCSEDGQLLGQNLKMVSNVMSLSAVNAALNKVVELMPYGEERLRYVINVLTGLTVKKEESPVNTLISFLIRVYEENGPLVGGTLNNVVLTKIIKTSNGMALEAFPLALTHVENSWNTLLHFLGMNNGGLPWIELIMPKGTVEEIYASLLKEKTILTSEALCYDLVNVDTNRFQTGSIITHNCGYGMGAAKFNLTCASWGIPITEELAQRAVDTYRLSYSRVRDSWYNQERAAIECVQSGRSVRCGKVEWRMEGSSLVCKLPSGRSLVYNEAALEYNETSRGERKIAVQFSHVDRKNQWSRSFTYGGKIVENITQAIARDLLASAMLRLEKKHYPVIFSVHDEIVSDVLEGYGSVEEYVEIMCANPLWAIDCPIVAEGWRGKRYKK